MVSQNAEMLSPKDYFFLASHQFPQRGSFLEGWEVESTKTFYHHGIIAITFINSNMKQLVIAFYVIDNTEVTQESLNYVVDFVKRAKQLAEDLEYQISYTGKYHGGTIAEFFATQDKLPCYVFDSQTIQDNEIYSK